MHAFSDFGEELAIGIITNVRETPMNCEMATKGRSINLENLIASMMLVA
jgi:hypothetical protein